MTTQPQDVVAFWRDAGQDSWFQVGDAFDARCEARFRDANFSAAARQRDDWLDSADGVLALALLLDQIPRDIFRKSAHAFATDPLARHMAGIAIDARHDHEFEPKLRGFVYLPFEHSVAMSDPDRSVALFTALGRDDDLDHARRHRDDIARFGGFPHRNRALGRESRAEERAYLDAGGGFG